MARKCFISFKTEDSKYKKYIQDDLDIDMIDKCLDDAIGSENDDYVMRIIREDYLHDSTVTIFLIGDFSNENLGKHEQRFIKRELQASLYHGNGNTINGILGVVLPPMYDKVFGESKVCKVCSNTHRITNINDSTVIKEFSYNYYIPNGRCSWRDEDRYCVLVKWDDFVTNPEMYIEKAFQKRDSPIAEKIKVRFN